ncbi:hypothetical protein MSG28_005085 [Choristoneura fumiferana]|uniref:Uncharacterized protein n=1 Tax=Choristoneura fumiferana TaxID=7141 RepID=A0ACC0JPT7_CHOFU|nr:hypothetical protein MSG28_005085 [Choristoneura fumiferana]
MQVQGKFKRPRYTRLELCTPSTSMKSHEDELSELKATISQKNKIEATKGYEQKSKAAYPLEQPQAEHRKPSHILSVFWPCSKEPQSEPCLWQRLHLRGLGAKQPLGPRLPLEGGSCTRTPDRMNERSLRFVALSRDGHGRSIAGYGSQQRARSPGIRRRRLPPLRTGSVPDGKIHRRRPRTFGTRGYAGLTAGTGQENQRAEISMNDIIRRSGLRVASVVGAGRDATGVSTRQAALRSPVRSK